MDELFFTSARSDALRWLAMADRQLEARDLHCSRSFALSSRKAEPSHDTDRILAIVDTLLGAERRHFVTNQPNWLAILHLTPPEGLDPSLISWQFQRLINLLHPRTNRHPYAEKAFDLIHQAYANLVPPPGLTPPINAPKPAALPRNVNLVGGVAQQQIVEVGQSNGGGRKSAQPTLQKHKFKGLFSSPNFEIGSGSSRNMGIAHKSKLCRGCGITSTPLWRKGPHGSQGSSTNLCNENTKLHQLLYIAARFQWKDDHLLALKDKW